MRKKDYKLKTIILLFVWLLLLIVIPFSVSKIKLYFNKNNVSYISSDFEIEEYNIILDVDKDSKIDVTENVTVNIPKDNYNGIYKSIPLWQKYYNKDMKDLKKKVKITNLRAIGEKFLLSNSNDNLGIRIGSNRTNVDKGSHIYTIKYRYNMGKDMNKGFDDLVFNIFDNYDNTKIKNLSITINMPSSLDKIDVLFLKDKEDISSNIKLIINGNTLSASLNDYLLDDSLAINLTLPDGYFKGGTYNYGIICLFICIATIIISICSFIAWKKHGKNYDKKYKTVEFYPPEDYDAAQIGYIYGEQSIKKLTTALIVQLASKNYISIQETGNKKYQIINIGKDNDKLKKLSITEQVVYQELFKNGDINTLASDISFAKVFEKISICLENVIDKKVNDVGSKRMTNIIFSLLFISITAWTVSYLFIKDLNPKFDILYLISFIAIFITGFFSIFMSRKTAYGESISAKILGFKDYLFTVEKDSLDALTEENQNYFFDILPYAYVLNISEKWISTFEKTNIPNIDIKELDFYEDSLFMIMSE